MENESFFAPAPEALQPAFQMSLLPLVGWVVGCIVIGVALFILFRKIRKWFRRPDLLGTSREDLQKRWRTIEELVNRGDETSAKLSVIEADKLLDHSLKAMGFGGNTMGERLKLVAYKFPRVRRAWHGHAIRNRLVHDASYHLSRTSARQALASFRDSLKELGIL